MKSKFLKSTALTLVLSVLLGILCACSLFKEEHTHNYSGMYYFDSEGHWMVCECGEKSESEAHRGGKATCDTEAVCEVCIQLYGDLGHRWNGELTTPVTEETDGTIRYTCSICNEKKYETVPAGETVLTRADLEAAIAEVAWAYYLKGEKMQYDSIALSAINNHYAGTCRHTREASPEYGTSDTTIYSVCTGYPTKVYLEALDSYIWGKKVSANGVTTMWIWLASDNQAEEGFADYYEEQTDPITENDRDTAIVRWMDFEKYMKNESEEVPYAYALGTFDSSAFVDWYEDGTLEFYKAEGEEIYSYYLDGRKITPDEAKMLVRNYILQKENGKYVNLRPGDLITEDTHTLVYVGNGYVLDCNGYKYDINSGADKVENTGVRKVKTLENILMKDAVSDYVITRPLDYYTTDYDGDPGNDIIMFEGELIEITEATKSRQQYPGIEIDRTVDITPYGTAAQNDTVTYTVKISNKSNEENYKAWRKSTDKSYFGQNYENLAVTEKIPEGTTFVSASEGYELNNGVLSWNVKVPLGYSVEITYTVKVTAEVGSTITSDGGMVANIPSNSISNRVGNAKLTDGQKETLSAIANSDTEQWKNDYGTGLEFAEGVYKELGVDMDLPTIENTIENLFTPTYFEEQISMTSYYRNIENPIVMYVPQENASEEYSQAYKMLVDRYFGGYRMFSADLEKFKEQGMQNYDFQKELDKMILEFSLDYLEVGDILVYVTAKNRGDTDLTSELESSRVLVYAGNGTLIEMSSDGTGTLYSGSAAESVLTSSFKNTNDLFFLLRPSEAIDVSVNG